MAITNKITYDLGTQEATFEYLQAGVLVSGWTLIGDQVTGTPLTAIEADADSSNASVQENARWIANIQNWWGPPIKPITPFREVFRKRDDDVKSILRIDGTKYVDATWDKGTDLISVKARPLFEHTWADYLNWHRHWKIFHAMVQNFKDELA